jgi:2-C-methyl-D-erythritol 4-phosphate cytidylyltransferase/2-C-methyl-D-erythritol 2,4-cyclodiphosphate synthase
VTDILKTEKITAVIVAAGRSTRMAGLDKQFANFGGRPLLAHTVAVFESSPLISEYVVVLNEDNLLRGRALAFEQGWRKLKKIVVGGSRRQDSVWNGLVALEDVTPPDWVMIHDGARPFVTPQILEDGLNAAREFGSSVAGVPVKDTIKIVSPENLTVRETPPRDLLWAVQTPQIFNYSLIVEAHRQAIACNLDVTDDAMMLEQLGHSVKLYQAAYTNIKVTTPDDLTLGRSIFEDRLQASGVQTQTEEKPERISNSETRIGQGYDVHRLVPDRPLILGGVTVPFELGLDGHSDADVLTHAIINALLGAAGLGDIGRYFPPTDAVYKDISSLKMLSHVYALVKERGWQIQNIDGTIAAQRPKLARHIPEMRQTLAETLGIEPNRINVKATTTETLGFVGRMEGLEAHAIALLSR